MSLASQHQLRMSDGSGSNDNILNSSQQKPSSYNSLEFRHIQVGVVPPNGGQRLEALCGHWGTSHPWVRHYHQDLQR